MTPHEAYIICLKKFPKMNFEKCTEFKTKFVFTVAAGGKIPLNGQFSVDKNTRKCQTFKPIDIPVDEFKAGKPVKNFK